MFAISICTTSSSAMRRCTSIGLPGGSALRRPSTSSSGLPAGGYGGRAGQEQGQIGEYSVQQASGSCYLVHTSSPRQRPTPLPRSAHLRPWRSCCSGSAPPCRSAAMVVVCM